MSDTTKNFQSPEEAIQFLADEIGKLKIRHNVLTLYVMMQNHLMLMNKEQHEKNQRVVLKIARERFPTLFPNDHEAALQEIESICTMLMQGEVVPFPQGEV